MQNKNYSIVLFLLFCGILNSVSAQNVNKILDKKGFEYVPSGVYINENDSVSIQGFFISATEVTNKQYAAFLNDLKAKGKTEYAIAKLDSTKWRLPNSSMEEFVKKYATDKQFEKYPVVNMSQKAAELYCLWLQEKLKAEGLSVFVRMPFEIEWEYAAKGGHNENVYAWEGNFLRNKKGLYLANFKTDKISEDGSYITAPVTSYKTNGFGVYNMCGNVSEWVHEEGICKGGNWNSAAQYLEITSKTEFSTVSPSPFIGFRPILVITSKI